MSCPFVVTVPVNEIPLTVPVPSTSVTVPPCVVILVPPISIYPKEAVEIAEPLTPPPTNVWLLPLSSP